MSSLTVLPAGTSQRQENSCCASLVLAANAECGAFMSAARDLFGDRLAFSAGDLWVEALQLDQSFQCGAVGFRKVTIVAAGMLADLMGVPRRTPDTSMEVPPAPTQGSSSMKFLSATSFVMLVPIERRIMPIATLCGAK
jgi:hypothetical protein